MEDIGAKLARLSPAKRSLVEERLGRTSSLIKDLENIKKGLAQEYQRVPRNQPLPVSHTQEIQLEYLEWIASHAVQVKPPEVFALFRITGQLDELALRKALGEIVRRREVFRTTFHHEGNGFTQIIHPPVEVPIGIECLREDSENDENATIRKFVNEQMLQPLDLANDLLLRVRLLRLREDDAVLLLITHHIIFDDYSQNLLVRELITLYGAFAKGAASPLPEPSLQFADFTYWQRQWLKGEILENLVAYWRRQLHGMQLMPELELPFDRVLPADATHQAASQYLHIPTQFYELIKNLASQKKITVFMLLLAVLKALLHFYTGKVDIAVVAPIANRHWPETENVIGYFANSLILRTDLSGDPEFTDLLQRVRKTTVDAYAHQDLPLPVLLKALNGDYESRRSYVFFNMVSETAQGLRQLPGLGIQMMNINRLNRVAKSGIRVHAKEGRSGLRLTFVYEAERLYADDVARMLHDFQSILKAVTLNAQRRLSELSPAKT